MNIRFFIIFIYIFFIFAVPKCLAVEPVWDIEFFVNEDEIIKDKPFEVDIYFAGEGEIKDNRVRISSDKDIVFIDEKFKKESDIIYKSIDVDNGFNKKVKVGDMLLPQAEIGIIGEKIDTINNDIEWKDLTSPSTIRVKTLRPGNHRLVATILYSDENDQWYIKKKELNIHTTSWYERNETWIICWGIVIGIFSLIFGGAYSIEIKRIINKIFSKIFKKN